jgi:Amt family ammonium transporter
MVFYAFSMVLMVWVLWAYNMSFGKPWGIMPGTGGNAFIGHPCPTTSAYNMEREAVIPSAAAGMPALGFPQSTMVYFQFVFAAITPIILAGSVLGRMSFKAWMIFVPLWTTFIYSVGAYSLWGGGWLANLGGVFHFSDAAGVVDYSGGYVIHLAAASSGFTAAAVIGPRLARDRESFHPNSLLITLAGAGLLWLGWSGFNGGDPFTANADAGVGVLNTHTATAAALLTWMFLDVFAYGKPSVLGAVNGMICGLVAITPAAGRDPHAWRGGGGWRYRHRYSGRSEHDRMVRHQERRDLRDRRYLWRLAPSCAAGLRRAVHHRVQRRGHVYSAQADRLGREAAYG